MRARLVFAICLAASGAAAETPDEVLARARTLEQAQEYRQALDAVTALDGAADLPARTRLEVLRRLGILRLVLRDEAGAREAFSRALSRDPGFDLGAGEHPPHFFRAFEAARASSPAPIAVRISARAEVADRRATFEIQVPEGADAVDSIVVSSRAVGGTAFEPVMLRPARETRAEMEVTADAIDWYVEARAPSGAVIATSGTAQAPSTARSARAFRVRSTEAPRPAGGPADPPDDDDGAVPTWIWIAGGVVLVAGGAVVAALALDPDVQVVAARSGDSGTLVVP